MYGSEPTWSSWPWVSRKASTLSLRSCQSVTSGSTRSTPSISSSGNIRPASMTTMFSSYSSAIMLRPISPKPPRGMARNLGCLAKKDELLLRLGDRGGDGGGNLAPLLHPVEVGFDGPEVLLQRAHQETVVEGRSRVVDGDVGHAVLADHFPVEARDRLISGQQTCQRVPAEHQDDFRLDQPELLLEIRRAGLRLGRLRIPVAGRPALEDVRDEDLAPGETETTKKLVEQLASRADERLALQVLVLAGRLADDHDPRVDRAYSRHRLGPRMTQRATPAIVDRRTQARQVDEIQTGANCMPGPEPRHTRYPQA